MNFYLSQKLQYVLELLKIDFLILQQYNITMVNLVARERPWSLDVSPRRDQRPQEVANPPGWMVERYRFV